MKETIVYNIITGADRYFLRATKEYYIPLPASPVYYIRVI